MRRAAFILMAICAAAPARSPAQHVLLFDDNDRSGDYRDASFGFAESGDYLKLLGSGANKLPVNDTLAYSGSDSGSLQYRHGTGTWEMFVAAPGWQGLDLSGMDTLILFLNGPEAIAPDELPRIGLEDTGNEKTGLIQMASYIDSLDADPDSWQRVAIPLADFQPVGSFTISSTKTVRFADSGPNVAARTLWFDLIVAISTTTGPPDGPPTDLATRTGDRSVILQWDPPEGAIGHRIVRFSGSSSAGELLTNSLVSPGFTDFDVENGTLYRYAIEAVGYDGRPSGESATIMATPTELDDDEFLELVAHTAFDYFWYEANPENGLIKDRSTPTSNSSIAAVGFGLTGIPIAIERGWIDRESGLERVLTTLDFFWNSSQGPDVAGVTGYKGFYYHFLNMETGLRAGTTELSTIDTALLLGGVLFVKEYFDGESEDEALVRALADSIYQRVDWVWASPRPPRVGHGWRPESGYIPYDWGGYNEAMILYLLALGSPTHPIPSSAWTAWTSGYHWETWYGYSFVRFPPLFGHQYTQVWFDLRGIQDAYMRGKGIDYFENSRRATLANRAYCVSNLQGWAGYGPDNWGLTASDGPHGYSARGAPPAQNDDGTISPTAAGGSVAFTPEESVAALRHMYETYRTRIWGAYGFKDAFNVEEDWFDTQYLGIDQGPILLMIENLRDEGVWKRFMRNSDIQEGLARAGFQPMGTPNEPPETPTRLDIQISSSPNPFRSSATVHFRLPEATDVQLTIFDALGRRVAMLVDGIRPAGVHDVAIDASSWSPGTYFYVLKAAGETKLGRIVHLD